MLQITKLQMDTSFSRTHRNLLWILLGTAITLSTLIVGYITLRPDKGQTAFIKFFGTKTATVRLLAYGRERSIFGDGSYGLLFTIPETELYELLAREGYSITEIQTNPEDWRLELCNSVIQRLTKTNIFIAPTSACYAKKSDQTDARVFYNKDDSLAIFVGFGRYPK